MAEYQVPSSGTADIPRPTPGKQEQKFTFTFEKIAMLGNAGKKIDLLVKDVIGGYVDDPKAPTPVTKKVLEAVGFAPTLEAKAFVDFLTGAGRQGNPSSAEIREGISIPGIVDRYSLPVGDHGKLPPVVMLPMWEADP